MRDQIMNGQEHKQEKDTNNKNIKISEFQRWSLKALAT